MFEWKCRFQFCRQTRQEMGKKIPRIDHIRGIFAACRKSLFAPLPSRFLNFKKFKNLLDWTRKGLFAPFTLSPLLYCGAAFYRFWTVSKRRNPVWISAFSACRKRLFAPLLCPVFWTWKVQKTAWLNAKGAFCPFHSIPAALLQNCIL